MKSCTICDKENAEFCAQCKSILYCSKACQKRDWGTHKLLCASFNTFNSSKRPTKDHRRAVLFNPDKPKPEFIWLLCLQYPDDFQMPEYKDIIGGDALPKDIPYRYNRRLGKNLPNTLMITHRDTFLIDGSRPNKSIGSITGTQPGSYHDWRGPIIVYARRGTGIEPPSCKDFDMVDFRHAADYFLSYGYTPSEGPASPKKVKGVRINCLGDVKMLKRPPFEAFEVPSTDPIFTRHDTSDIADRIGIPILTRRLSPDPKWNNSDDAMFGSTSPCCNQDATFLHLCCNPKAKSDLSTETLGWGFASKLWQNNVGSVIVVRKDRKPLLPMHMEALAGYCRNDIQPLLSHADGGYYPEVPIAKEVVLKFICRPTFVIYWYKFCEERNDNKTPDPYDEDL